MLNEVGEWKRGFDVAKDGQLPVKMRSALLGMATAIMC